MNSHRQITYMTSITIMLILACIADVMWGGHANMDIMLHLRLPRMVTALLAGAAMALSGSQMQSIFRNPLADPHIMGISSGAALGAAITTMYAGVALGGAPIAISAAIGAGAAAAVILYASRKFSNASVLLIFGVMLGFIVTAAVTVLQFSSDAESLKTYYSWSAGSFSNSGWNEIGILAATLAAGLILTARNTKGLDIILFGDEFATMAGAPVHRIRLVSIISCCLITAAVTAFCGPIGFVGIVAPHIARGIFKTSSHRVILPASLLTGGITALAADLLSRTTSSPVPIASTMAIVGVPVIIYILLKGRRYGE